MDKTARQLYDQYRGKLLWLSLKGGGVIIGQPVALPAAPNLPERSKGLQFWIVGNLAGFFREKGSVPEKPHLTLHPSDIASIAVLDWNEKGGAQQLAQLAARKLIKIKTSSGHQIFGMICDTDNSSSAHQSIEECIDVVQLENRYAYVRIADAGGSVVEGGYAKIQVQLKEIVALEVVQRPVIARPK